jgi:Holliday junction resolvase
MSAYPALAGVSPTAFFAAEVLVGAALEEEGAAAVRAEVVEGLDVPTADVRALVGLVAAGRAGKEARDAVEDARVDLRSDEVEAVLAWPAAVRDAVPLVPVVLPDRVDMRFDKPLAAFLLSSPDVRLPLPS